MQILFYWNTEYENLETPAFIRREELGLRSQGRQLLQFPWISAGTKPRLLPF